jgi:hypothetical protein
MPPDASSLVEDAMAAQQRALRDNGWLLLPSFLRASLVTRLARALDEVYVEQRAMQISNGVAAGAEGTVHHLPCAGGIFLELLEHGHGQPLLDRYFRGPYILNTYGGVVNAPGGASYVARVHRDQRTFSGDLHLMAQLLIMLDAFTEDNGATWLLTGSHRLAEKPADDAFFKEAVRAVGPAGSIVLFDSNLWHAAGANRTDRPRRALTLAFTRPFMKQQLDYPRALGYDRCNSFSPALRQLLGYNARVPASLDEWYQPPSRRMYKREQG